MFKKMVYRPKNKKKRSLLAMPAGVASDLRVSYPL